MPYGLRPSCHATLITGVVMSQSGWHFLSQHAGPGGGLREWVGRGTSNHCRSCERTASWWIGESDNWRRGRDSIRPELTVLVIGAAFRPAVAIMPQLARVLAPARTASVARHHIARGGARQRLRGRYEGGSISTALAVRPSGNAGAGKNYRCATPNIEQPKVRYRSGSLCSS